MIGRRTRAAVASCGLVLFLAVVAAAQQQAPTPKPTPKAQVVYVTKTGEKYHLSSCRHLAKSRIELSLEEAKRRGLGACAVCKPPKAP